MRDKQDEETREPSIYLRPRILWAASIAILSSSCAIFSKLCNQPASLLPLLAGVSQDILNQRDSHANNITTAIYQNPGADEPDSIYATFGSLLVVSSALDYIYSDSWGSCGLTLLETVSMLELPFPARNSIPYQHGVQRNGHCHSQSRNRPTLSPNKAAAKEWLVAYEGYTIPSFGNQLGPWLSDFITK